MKRLGVLVVAAGLLASPAWGAPAPGIGLLVKAADMPALRKKLTREPWSRIYAKIKGRADEAVADWPARRGEISPHLDKLLDLSVRHTKVPADPAVRAAGQALAEFALRRMCPAAFVYLITGERKYAQAAYDILLHMGKVNRWGWFPWAGSHMPQIHAGMHFRNAAFTLDFLWDALSPGQRAQARRILAEKAVEPYFRIVLHAPAMGLHHLRSKNQGNNVLAGALIACLALGEDYPNAKTWRRSYTQTFHWIVTHDIGWAGQGLESGLPGYWSVSMQNLYTAATCLYNVTGIDLRVHPAFAEATYYPVYHETTVPPVRQFTAPIDRSYEAGVGIIAGKPIELPHTASGGSWWYDYAGRFPDSPARYFINRTMVRKDRQGRLSFRIHNCHQEGHADILALLWTKPGLHDPGVRGPTALFKTTDRMSMVRSGYGHGRTYLYFNGDVFLSALGEILCTTSGLAWHYKWHGWQKAETGVETEGRPLAPSMVVRGSWHDEDFTFLHTVSGTSNIRYYPPPGHNECYRRYRRRDRDILYVRGRPGSDPAPRAKPLRRGGAPSRASGSNDYLVFVDRVAQAAPRWHGWLWQAWNSVYRNRRENAGRYKVESDRRVRLERPNADLAIEFVAPGALAFEVESAPGQPIVSYMYDHNVLTLRALAGGYGRVRGDKVVIPPSAWRGSGKVLAGADLGEGGPEAAYRLIGAEQIVRGANGFEVPARLEPGVRYRMRIPCRKQDLKVYENLAWELNLELLDAKGDIVARDTALEDASKARRYNRPGRFRLCDPRSLTPTTPWIRTEYVHFDVPPGAKVARIRGRLAAATWSHPPHKIHEKSVLDLGPITIEPLGTVQRRRAETFGAVVTPLRKGAAAPDIRRTRGDGWVAAQIRRKDGSIDHLFIADGKPATSGLGTIAAELAVVNVAKGRPRRLFARAATRITVHGRPVLSSPRPVSLGIRWDAQGRLARVRIEAPGPVKAVLAGREVTLPAGRSVGGPDLKLAADPAASLLAANSPASQKLLKAALAPLISGHVAERDAYAQKAGKNLALAAKVTASGTRDPRFGPEHVIDNRTWEYPTDGLLDYTQGDLRTTPLGGYGREKLPLAGKSMSIWPFYVRPTYWLLPYEKAGWIELALPREQNVGLVRLLNTSNAGLNDYATMRYRVELRDASGKVVGRYKGCFGKRFDRPFAQAFRYPKLFSSYGRTFQGMLEPGIPVPFGDGWHDIKVRPARARFVKVYIDSYWAVGGGLNEIQVYAPAARIATAPGNVAVR